MSDTERLTALEKAMYSSWAGSEVRLDQFLDRLVETGIIRTEETRSMIHNWSSNIRAAMGVSQRGDCISHPPKQAPEEGDLLDLHLKLDKQVMNISKNVTDRFGEIQREIDKLEQRIYTLSNLRRKQDQPRLNKAHNRIELLEKERIVDAQTLNDHLARIEKIEKQLTFWMSRGNSTMDRVEKLEALEREYQATIRYMQQQQEINAELQRQIDDLKPKPVPAHVTTPQELREMEQSEDIWHRIFEAAKYEFTGKLIQSPGDEEDQMELRDIIAVFDEVVDRFKVELKK